MQAAGPIHCRNQTLERARLLPAVGVAARAHLRGGEHRQRHAVAVLLQPRYLSEHADDLSRQGLPGPAHDDGHHPRQHRHLGGFHGRALGRRDGGHLPCRAPDGGGHSPVPCGGRRLRPRQRAAHDEIQRALVHDRDTVDDDHLPRHRLCHPREPGGGQVPGVVLPARVGLRGRGSHHRHRLRGVCGGVLDPAPQDRLRPQDLRHGRQHDHLALFRRQDRLHRRRRERAHGAHGRVHRALSHLPHGQHPSQRRPRLRAGGHRHGRARRREHHGRQGWAGRAAAGDLHHRFPELRARARQHPGPGPPDHRRAPADPFGPRAQRPVSRQAAGEQYLWHRSSSTGRIPPGERKSQEEEL